MSWADYAKRELSQGQVVVIRPRGTSMSGKIESGQEVTLEPVGPALVLAVGDMVLVRVKGRDYVHLIKAIRGDRYQIGNNRGGINGWVGRQAIYGKVVKVGD